jgi:phage terminase large subunit-like protein
VDFVTEYWKAIEEGRVIVCKRTRAIYKRLAAEIANPGRWVFDEARATRPIAFIERFCRHSKGEWAGQPVRLELWQKAFISALFGFIDPDTKLRRFREGFLEVGRKNGKSTLLSGIALYMLTSDGESGAEVYSVATKRDQAKLVFDEAHNMVRQSPQLRQVIKKRRADLYVDMTMSKFQPLGRNSNTLDGLNASCVIMDELHGIQDRNLYEVMKQSQSARQQPLLVMITTAGTVRECIFDDIYAYACGIIDGTFHDDTFLPVIYELDSRREWEDPDCWQKANPGLGTIKKVDNLRQKVERAKQVPKDLAGVLCKDFDMKQSSSSSWLTFDDVNNQDTFDVERFRGCYAIGGADLSITTDLTCASLLMLDPVTEQRFVTQMYWLPEANFQERVHKEHIPYDKWVEEGLVRLCQGNTIVYSDVTAWFVEMVEKHGITPAWIYYDPYSARYWVDEMESNGFNMVKCFQGVRTLSLPMQHLGQDLKAKRVNYQNNPITRWCLTNTGVKVDVNGNIQPVKAQGAKQRIDGLASMLDAYVGLVDHYEEFKGANA